VVVETDQEAAAEMEAEVAEAGSMTTEDAVAAAKWLVTKIDVTTGRETDVDVTICKRNPTISMLVVVVVEMVVVARQEVETLTETSACEWTSLVTTNRMAIKMIPTVTTKAMIKATIRATILLLVAGVVHLVEDGVVEDVVVLPAARTEKVTNSRSPRLNLRKGNKKEDKKMERVRALPMQLPSILLPWWPQRMVVIVVAGIVLVIVAAVEEEDVDAAISRAGSTCRVLLLPSRGSERRMARVEMAMPTAALVEEEAKHKNESCLAWHTKKCSAKPGPDLI
jgi:hypothetical protein